MCLCVCSLCVCVFLYLCVRFAWFGCLHVRVLCALVCMCAFVSLLRAPVIYVWAFVAGVFMYLCVTCWYGLHFFCCDVWLCDRVFGVVFFSVIVYVCVGDVCLCACEFVRLCVGKFVCWRLNVSAFVSLCSLALCVVCCVLCDLCCVLCVVRLRVCVCVVCVFVSVCVVFMSVACLCVCMVVVVCACGLCFFCVFGCLCVCVVVCLRVCVMCVYAFASSHVCACA